MALELLLLGLPQLKIIRAFRHEHEALRSAQATADASVSPFQAQLQRTAEKLDIPRSDVEITVARWMIERPCRWLPRFKRQALIDELSRFRAGGGKTGLVSDYPARRKLEALGLSDAFDVVVANGEDHGPERLKPDPDGYLKAATTLGVPANECLIIGDRDDADGAAARAAGMAFRLVH
jgi:FMN phosphatase YigB (HAD superfamily)